MDNEAAREESYIKALMMLGPRPREPDYDVKPVPYSRADMQVYMRRLNYDEAVLGYYMEHVFSPRFSTWQTWVSDFYHWQLDQAELHACKGEEDE